MVGKGAKLPLDYPIDKSFKIYYKRLKIFGLVFLFNSGIIAILALSKLGDSFSSNSEYSSNFIEPSTISSYVTLKYVSIAIVFCCFFAAFTYAFQRLISNASKSYEQSKKSRGANRTTNFSIRKPRPVYSRNLVPALSVATLLVCVLIGSQFTVNNSSISAIGSYSVNTIGEVPIDDLHEKSAVIAGSYPGSREVRAEAGSDKETIFQLPVGSYVDIVALSSAGNDIWYKVYSPQEDRYGWISEDLIEINHPGSF